MAMTYRKGFLYCFVVAMSILLQGCGKQEVHNAETVPDSEAVIISDDLTYEMSSDRLLQGLEGEVQQCSVQKDMLYILTHQQQTSHLYRTMIDGSDVVEIPVSLSEHAGINSFYVDEEGILCLTSVEGTDPQMALVKLDAEGQETTRVELQELLALSGENLLNRITVDGSGHVIVASESTVYCLDLERQSVDKIRAQENYGVITFIKTRSGNIACVVGMRDEDGDIDGRICILDTGKGEWGKFISMDKEPLIDEFCLMEGQEYEFYYKDGGGIFGYNSEGDTTWTKVLDARCSLLSLRDIRGMIWGGEDRFLRIPFDSKDSEEGLVVEWYSRFNPEELENKTVITYAGYNVTSQLREAAKEFNKTHTDCRVYIQIYDDEEHTRLALDIATGKVPDIFSISAVSFEGIPMEKWVRMGILEDLVPYYEKDADIHMEDIVPSVLEGMKTGDKLYCVSPYFYIWSAACRTSDAEGRDGWNFEEMKEALAKKGKGAVAFEALEKEDILFEFLISSEKDFVDWETGECRFDSREFKDILEFCNEGSFTGQMSDQEYDVMHEEIETKMQEGKVLLSVDQGVAVYSLQETRQRFGSDITYIGVPAKDRQGSYFMFSEQYGIYSGSKVKDEAWEFIRMVMSGEYQRNTRMIDSAFFPTRRDCLEWRMQAEMATEPYEDAYGNLIEPVKTDSWYTESGTKIKVGPASQEDVDILWDLIERTKERAALDDEMAQIILEEAAEYFQGNKSLDKAAEIIQKRITTYVNEQR